MLTLGVSVNCRCQGISSCTQTRSLYHHQKQSLDQTYLVVVHQYVEDDQCVGLLDVFCPVKVSCSLADHGHCIVTYIPIAYILLAPGQLCQAAGCGKF